MGYYVSLVSSRFIIPAKNVPAAFESLKSLNGPEFDNYKIEPSDPSQPPYYSWMSHDWDKTVQSIGDILWLLNIESNVRSDGSVEIVNFDNKWRREIPLFLSVLAPYTEDEGYLEFHGEDSRDWTQYVVESGELIEYYGEIKWTRFGRVKF